MSAEPKLEWPCPCGCALVIDEDGNERARPQTSWEHQKYGEWQLVSDEAGEHYRSILTERAQRKCRR